VGTKPSLDIVVKKKEKKTSIKWESNTPTSNYYFSGCHSYDFMT